MALPSFTLADSVVTDSSLNSLYAALLRGGRVTFSGAFAFNLTNPIPIVRDTILDASENNSPVVFDGRNVTGLFTVCTNVTLQLFNVTLSNGRGTNGGAILIQGGSLIANNCLFSGNQSPNGGAIFNQSGTFTASNCNFIGNQSPNGGAILNQGRNLLANDCLFSTNQSVNGGAILNQSGAFIATNCVFSDNAAVGPPGPDGVPGQSSPFGGRDGGSGGPGTSASGGAIYGLGPVEVYLCRFVRNRAAGGNGGQGGLGGAGLVSIVGGSIGGNGGNGGQAGVALGGAVYSTQRVVLADCSFEVNTVIGGNGGQGGVAGLATSSNNITLSTAGLSAAGAVAEGGAIYGLGQLLVARCTFATNAATGGVAAGEFADNVGFGRPGPNGGAALGGAIYAGGTNGWVNCTFSANNTQGGAGGTGGDGPVYSGGNGGSGGAALGGALWIAGQSGATNCTFASSSAAGGLGGAGGIAGTGGIVNQAGNPGTTGSAGGGNLATGTGGTLTLENCIVANSPSGGNCFGGLVDAGHNLSSDATCRFSALGSMNNTDPMLGALGDYGGPTQTIPLLVNTDDHGCQGCTGILTNQNPAIDAGTAIPGLATDQRGVPRPQGAGFDIGAFECVALVGQLRQCDGTPFANATVWMLSTFSAQLHTVTDAQGRYQIVAPPDLGMNLGVYWVEPEAGGTIFSPPYTEVQLGPPNTTAAHLDFTEVLAMGQVRQWDGSPLTNALVSLVSTSSPPVTAVTDAQGNYQIVAPPNVILNPGEYRIMPQAGAAIFSPASVPLQLGSPRTTTNLVFTECVAVGQVRRFDGAPFTNLTVSLSSGSSALVTAVTDAQGRYQLVISPGMTLNPGVYQVGPQAGAVVFLPASVPVQLGPLTAGTAQLDFTEPVAVGQARQFDGSPFTNVTISLAAGSSPPVTTVTDAQGRYQIVAPPNSVLSPGVYWITPQAGAAIFSPASIQVQLGNPRTTTNLVFSECVALGQVRRFDGSPFTNVTISLISTSSLPWTARTDALGRYQVVAPPNTILSPGAYQVRPQAGAAVFSPAYLQLQLGSPRTSTNLDFTESLALAGQVKQFDGAPFTNVTVWLLSTLSPPVTAQTDAQGRYQILLSAGMNLAPGSYNLVPQAGAAVFSPASTEVLIGSPAVSHTDLDFVSRLTGGFTPSNGFQLIGGAAPGLAFRVEAATNLLGPWLPLGTAAIGQDSQLEFTDPSAQSFPTRFYRLVPQNP